MKIISSDGTQLIYISNDVITIKQDHIKYSKSHIKSFFRIMLNTLKNNKILKKILYIDSLPKNNIDTCVLLGLAMNKNRFFIGKELYDLTISYAMPIGNDKRIIKFIFKNLKSCLKNRQLVLQKRSDLYIQTKINEKKLKKIFHDEKRTLNRNKNIKIQKVNFSKKFFKFWNNYDNRRFKETHTKDFEMFFKRLYKLDNFVLYKYTFLDNVIAYNVCYFSNDEKILYDVLFPWEKSNYAYRIGILSILNNLVKAYNMKYGYSLCYGVFDYKNSIFNKL